MPHFLQDVAQLSLFLGLAGNKEGDKISFSFFSLWDDVVNVRQCRVIGGNKF